MAVFVGVIDLWDGVPVGVGVDVSGKSEQAAQLFGVVDFFLRSSRPFEAADEKDYAYYLSAVREQLNESMFEKAWSEGRKMTPEQAIAFVLEESNN